MSNNILAPILYLSPTTDSALEHLLNYFQQLKAENPLAPVHILLPSSRVIHAVRRRLGQGMNLRLFEFYGISQTVLDLTGTAVHCVSDITVHCLVDYFLTEMSTKGELTSFTAVWQKPGFSQVIVEWLREMKSQGIWPDDFTNHPLPTNPERDRQLGILYERYQSFLQQNVLSDPDGLLWLAAEALERTSGLLNSPGLLVVFGFDQFNPLQLRILRTLAGRFHQTFVYLTWDINRLPESLALARLKDTRTQLEQILPFSIETLPDVSSDLQRTTIARIRSKLFEPSEKTDPADHSEVRMVAAPSREAETRQVLRQVKRLLLTGVSPDEVAILAPQPGVYGRLLATVSEEYGVPLRQGSRLEHQPVIAALLNLLRLFPAFPWRGVMDALRSPYISQTWLTQDQIDLLDQLSREQPVLNGREQWGYALRPLSADGDHAEDDEDLGPPSLRSQLTPESLSAIEAGLNVFFDHLTPPSEADYPDYVLWIQEKLLGLYDQPEEEQESNLESSTSLQMMACIDAGNNPQTERIALGLALRALRGLVEAVDLAPTQADAQVQWSDFVIDVLNILPSVEIRPDMRQPGVHFGALESGRSVGVDHLFVLGLAEGEFPKPPAPDPLYTIRERQDHPLPVLRYKSGEDNSLWWQVLANARCSLTLLRPYLDESGAPWLPSPYWVEVREVLGWSEDAEERIPIADTASISESASVVELLTALVVAGVNQVPEELQKLWGRSCRSYTVLCMRDSWQPLSAFEGQFESPELIAELAGRYGPQYVWSASRLNRYGNCPYSFFAQTVLKLEERPDPSEGLNAMQRGSLLHAVLEVLFRKLVEQGLSLTSETQADALVLLDQTCDDVFVRAPMRYGFHPGPLWHYEQEEMHRLLQAVIKWECEDKQQGMRFRPYQQELRFGIQGAEHAELNLRTSDNETILLHGVIDRIDRDANGLMRLIDYKSGSTKYTGKDINEGLAFQVPLYALAAEQAIHLSVAESYYLHLPLRQTSAKLEFNQGAAQDDSVQTSVEKAIEFVKHIRNGDFPSLPAKPAYGANTCSKNCAFGAICRVNRHTRLKALRYARSERVRSEATQ